MKKKNKKKYESTRRPCEASSGFQWTSFLHFVCSRALTLPAEVWWLAKPFVPAEAPLVRHRAADSAAGEDATIGSQATLLCTFSVSHYRLVSILYVFTCACVYDVHSLLRFISIVFFVFLTLNEFDGSEKRAVSHRRCDRALCRISSGWKYRVYEKLTFLITCFLFLSLFSRVFEYHIYFEYRPFPPVSTVPSQFYVTCISSFLSRLVVEMQFLCRVRCAWNRACICRDYCFRDC